MKLAAGLEAAGLLLVGRGHATTLGCLDYVRFRPATTYSHMVCLLGTGLLDQAIRPTVGVGADAVENHFWYLWAGVKVDWKRGSWALDGKGTLGALKLQSDGWHEHDIDSMLRLRWTRAALLFGGVVAGLGYETDGRKLHPWGGVTTGFDFAVTREAGGEAPAFGPAAPTESLELLSLFARKPGPTGRRRRRALKSERRSRPSDRTSENEDVVVPVPRD